MKRWVRLLMTLMGVLLLVGCSSQPKEEPTYDEEFIENLARGLDKRWEYADNASVEPSKEKEVLKQSIQLELDQIGDFVNKRFADSQLQEAALTYINELKAGQKLVDDSYGANVFYQKWEEHQDSRTKKLANIGSIRKIPVKNESILQDLTNQGNAVQQEENTRKELEQLVQSITFTKTEEPYSHEYVATVTNTTDKDIKTLALKIDLFDKDQVKLDTAHAHIDNWAKDQTIKVKFFANEEFTKTEIHVDYFEIN